MKHINDEFPDYTEDNQILIRKNKENNTHNNAYHSNINKTALYTHAYNI